MSREIKIRFWDKTTNTMIYPIANYESICIVNGKMKPSLSNSIVDNWNWYKREYEPLEYTGLKDKNGTEIYEGDIVNFRNGESKLYIAFNLGQWSMCRYLDEPDKNYRNLDHYVNHDGPIEVVGNIYKNPELLEED